MLFMQNFVFNSHKKSCNAHEYLSENPSFFEIIFIHENIRYRYGFIVDKSYIHNEWLFSYDKGPQRLLFLRSQEEVQFGKFWEGRQKFYIEKNSLLLYEAGEYLETIANKVMRWWGFCSNENIDFNMDISEIIRYYLKHNVRLVVDNLDNYFHPLSIDSIITQFNNKLINQNKSQLIFTTHNTHFLNKKLLRRDQIWFTDKEEDGNTKLYSLYDIIERKNEDFEKWYLSGRYGAIPIID